jgi:hypothetical protein
MACHRPLPNSRRELGLYHETTSNWPKKKTYRQFCKIRKFWPLQIRILNNFAGYDHSDIKKTYSLEISDFTGGQIIVGYRDTIQETCDAVRMPTQLRPWGQLK